MRLAINRRPEGEVLRITNRVSWLQSLFPQTCASGTSALGPASVPTLYVTSESIFLSRLQFPVLGPVIFRSSLFPGGLRWQIDRMSGVFNMVPSAAWGLTDFLKSLLLPQQMAAILGCDAMTPSFQRGCFQQTCILSKYRTGHLQSANINSPFFRMTMSKHHQVEPTQTQLLHSHTFFFLWMKLKKREKRGKTQHPALFSRVNSENRTIVNIY